MYTKPQIIPKVIPRQSTTLTNSGERLCYVCRYGNIGVLSDNLGVVFMAVWNYTDDAIKEQVRQLQDKGADLTDQAEYFGVQLESLKRYLRRYKQYNPPTESQPPTITFPYMERPPELTPLEITTDNAIIIGDIEVPNHSHKYLAQVLFTGMVHNIKTLIIAGDFVATDQGSLNSWPTIWRLKSDMSYPAACQMACDILNRLSLWFENIYIIEGNHDNRIARATGGEVDLGMMLAETEAQYSRIAYMWINTSRGMVKVSHPKNYSKNPVTLCQRLLNTEPRKGHYVIGHCHRMQSGMSEDGLFEMHSIGTGRAFAKYKDQHDTTHPAWDISFLMMSDNTTNYFTHLGDKVTNWAAHFGALYPEYLRSITPLPHSPQPAQPPEAKPIRAAQSVANGNLYTSLL